MRTDYNNCIEQNNINVDSISQEWEYKHWASEDSGNDYEKLLTQVHLIKNAGNNKYRRRRSVKQLM